MRSFIRKPSLKKSFSARTKGRATRSMKRMINPTYGKKGMGMLTNPKKSMYNKVYSHTSISAMPKGSKKKISSSHSDDGCWGCGCLIIFMIIVFIVCLLV